MDQMNEKYRVNTVGLWASAFVLAGLILSQASRMQFAHADSTAGNSGFSMSTVTSGIQLGTETHDLLWVVDDRSETLMIFYGDVGNRILEVKTVKNVSDLFQQARPN